MATLAQISAKMKKLPVLPIWQSTQAVTRVYAAAPAMIEALCPPKPKLLDITTRSFRSRGVFGV
jgi:hypothetical protein